MKAIPIGKDNFEDLRKGNCYYVDKTKTIEELLQNESTVVLYPRPRRFGKSLFISMLENFFEVTKKEQNQNLFDGLYIKNSPYYKEYGKYPVIELDFKELKANDYESSFNSYKILISRIYKQKEYIIEVLDENEKDTYSSFLSKTASEEDYKYSLKYLSDWLYRYHKEKTIILIDEYDVPVQQSYVLGFYNEMIDFLKRVFSSALKGNDSLKLGVMTGVLRVSKESIFSDLNNVKIYGVMDRAYNEAFGFTEKETKKLLEYYGLSLTEEIKNYYDGYNFAGLSIYNPWSILNYAADKELKSYWINTSSNDLIRKLLGSTTEENKIVIENLLKGESVSFTYDDRITYQDFDEIKDMNKVLNLLLVSGYITFDKETYDEVLEEKKNYFKIPNKEVRDELVRMVQQVTYQKELVNYQEFDEFRRNLILGEKKGVEKYLNQLLPSISYHDKMESFYHGYLLGLFGGFMNQNFIIKSNREAGLGRFDILIEKVDKKYGMVIEIKISEEEEKMEEYAEIARKQMKEKEYYKELILDKIEQTHEYAIVFYNKKCIVR